MDSSSAGAAPRLAALLAGSAVQRVEAYTELMTLANGDAADCTTDLSRATIHVGGLADHDVESRLGERLGRFGTVLAVTLRRVEGEGKESGSWALCTYAEPSESQRALEGPLHEVVRKLETQQVLGSTGVMGEVLSEHRRRLQIRVAAACVAPLVEKVLCADASQVDAAEFQRASIVLGSLCRMAVEVPPPGPHTSLCLHLLPCCVQQSQLMPIPCSWPLLRAGRGRGDAQRPVSCSMGSTMQRPERGDRLQEPERVHAR